MPIPTRRFVALVAAASVVLLVLPGERWLRLLVANGALVVLAAVDWLRCARPGAIEVARQLPKAISLGGTGEIGWTVRAPQARHDVRLALADDLAPSLHASTRRFAAHVPAGGTVTASATLRPGRRGRFLLRHVVVRVHGPFRLVSRQGTIVAPATLKVLPRYRSRERAEALARSRVLDVGLRLARGRGTGTEFEQLREYTPDDETRRMDWAATARTGRPIVRAYRAERNQTVVVLLDNGRVMAGRVDGVPRVEHAMDACMALTTVAIHLADRVGLVTFDRQVRAIVPPSHRKDQLGLMSDAMYDLEPELAESDYLGAFVQATARFRRRALYVVFTELASAALDEGLLPALPVLVRHHVVLVASVRDPDVLAWAQDAAPDPDAAYRRAAAVTALAERDRSAALLRSRGAIVVDLPPDDLAMGVAEAYLRVKATGRL